MTKRLILAASLSALCFSAEAADSITIVNPSFQADVFGASPGYIGGANPASITGWLHTGGVGINGSDLGAGTPFADNGLFPDGSRVAFIQGPGSLTQNLSGFTVGDLYWVQGTANARNCCGDIPVATLSIAGTTLINNQPLTPVGGTNPWYIISVPWIATATSGDLTISSFASVGGDAALAVDGISIIRRTTADVMISNPSFEASGNSFPFPGYTNSIAGWTRSSTANLIINGSNGSGNPFADNGLIPEGGNVAGLQQAETLSQTLTGLTIGQQYRFELDYNSRNGDDPAALFTIAGLTAFSGTVPEVGGANPYHHLTYDFIATATTATLTIANTLPSPTDSTLLVDNVRVQLVPEPTSIALIGLGTLLTARRRRIASRG